MGLCGSDQERLSDERDPATGEYEKFTGVGGRGPDRDEGMNE